MDHFTVTDIIGHSTSDTRPIIVEFQNGLLNSSNVHHKIYTEGKSTFVKVETKVLYKGEVKNDSFCNNFLVVVDKDTQEATLLPVDYAVLTPEVKVEDESEETTENDYRTAVQTLRKEFGSKRTKLLVQQEERMRLNRKNTTESLEAAVAEMEMDETNLETTITDSSDATYVPPINRAASSVDEVYSLYSLVPKEVLNSLDEGVQQILEGYDCDFLNTDLVKRCIERKKDSGASKKTAKHCKVLLVVDCILKFLSLPLKVIAAKRYTACEYSQLVSEYILSQFTIIGRNGRNRSASMKDKAICYSMVLLALVNDYTVNLDELCKELKLKINKLQSIAKLLAFVPRQPKDKTIFVLKLPLPAPVQYLARTPKRKR